MIFIFSRIYKLLTLKSNPKTYFISYRVVMRVKSWWAVMTARLASLLFIYFIKNKAFNFNSIILLIFASLKFCWLSLGNKCNFFSIYLKDYKLSIRSLQDWAYISNWSWLQVIIFMLTLISLLLMSIGCWFFILWSREI